MLFRQSAKIGNRVYQLVVAISLIALAACTSATSTAANPGTANPGTATDASALTIPGPTGPLETHTITVEAVPTSDEAGLYIAKDLGYFQREGLTVNIQPVGGGELAIPDLNAGKTDLAAGNYVSFIQAQITHKANLRIIADGSLMQPGNQALYVLPGSKLTTVASLVTHHAKIGVNTQNNIGTVLIGSLLQDNGFPLSAVHLVAPPPPGNPFLTLLSWLKSGTVDAAWLPEPFATNAEQQFGAVKIADFDSGSLRNFPIGAYVGTAQWVQSHPNTVAAFLHAVQEGQQVADVNRAQVETSLVSNTLVPNKIPLGAADQIAALMTINSYPLTMDVSTMQRVSNAMFEFNLEPGYKRLPYNLQNMIQPEPGMIMPMHG
jgi:NitT/TauT family transport system substrate-binding protein